MKERIWKEKFPWILGQVRKQIKTEKLLMENVIEDLKGFGRGSACPEWGCELCDKLFPEMDEYDCPQHTYNSNDLRSLGVYLRRKLTEDLEKEKK